MARRVPRRASKKVIATRACRAVKFFRGGRALPDVAATLRMNPKQLHDAILQNPKALKAFRTHFSPALETAEKHGTRRAFLTGLSKQTGFTLAELEKIFAREGNKP